MFELLAKRGIKYTIDGNRVWANGPLKHTVDLMSYKNKYSEVIYPPDDVVTRISAKGFMVSVMVKLNRVEKTDSSWSDKYDVKAETLLIIGETLEDVLVRAEIILSEKFSKFNYTSVVEANTTARQLNKEAQRN